MARKNSSLKQAQNTPMMRQFMSIKDQYPDAILMYRMGDFYEMFFEDAALASDALDLTLTSRNKNDPTPIPMCGIPHHASIGYISRLIEQGFKVAVCEQMEDPSQTKGLVRREVVRVITPGVILDDENLDARVNNYLAAIIPASCDADNVETINFGLAVIDVSTGEFKGTNVLGIASVVGELFRLEPRELLVPDFMETAVLDIKSVLKNCYVSSIDSEEFSFAKNGQLLEQIIGEHEAQALVAENQEVACAACAAVQYVAATRPKDKLPETRFVQYKIFDHLIIDETTKDHLELVQTKESSKTGSLLWLLDKTKTPMGGRLLRQWINYPLCHTSALARRLARVELFYEDTAFRRDTREILAQIADLERITTRVGVGSASPRELGVLRSSLEQIPELDDLLTSCPMPDSESLLGGELDRCEELTILLRNALVDNPPASKVDADIIRESFNKTLDDFRNTAKNAKDFIANLEQRERKKTGINSLKVSFNKVFGYFIFVTKPNLSLVPEGYIRKQTVANGERFITAELQEWESKVLTADEKKRVLEKELFDQLCASVHAFKERLSCLSAQIATIDCASALAQAAIVNDYVKPEFNKEGIIDIKDGRHPLVEALFTETAFVPNDVYLGMEKNRLMVITGPNMAGKSTVMRQVALICIMAQMGSFVPASSANLSITDRIFTRIGASDNIASGASTFMVEMKETSSILRNATTQSLVVLDEVGRGTSTFDGLSIAWAVGEYLHDTIGCKTMFATHYHELVELAGVKPYAVNYRVEAREYGNDVVFMRKLVEGGTSSSFGIQVARMAGLPELALIRAKEILDELEKEESRTSLGSSKPAKTVKTPQLDLFASSGLTKIEKILKELDLNRITPIEAISLLARLKEML